MARSTSNSFFRTSPAFSRSRCRSLFAAIPRSARTAPKLVPKFFAKMTKSSFGEDCGFRANWIRTEQEEMCFDMLACPYQDTCVKYGCPEIVAGFCRADDEAYGHMHPKLKWGRTKTLGQGGDCCDFRLTIE